MLAASAATAIAQAPPNPPAVFYGTAGGATDGQALTALVFTGGKGTTCGDFGLVQGSNYSVQVLDNTQKAGCGAPGRTIQFYFGASAGQGGFLSNETPVWPGSGQAVELDLTKGTQLNIVGYVPHVSDDGPSQ